MGYMRPMMLPSEPLPLVAAFATRLDALCDHRGWDTPLLCVPSPVARAEVLLNKPSVSTLGRCFSHSLLHRQFLEQFAMKTWGQFSPRSAFDCKTRLWPWQTSVSLTVTLLQNIPVYGMNIRSSVHTRTCQRIESVFKQVDVCCFSRTLMLR